MKKKLRDCTYGEVQRYCEKEFAKKCENCPLRFRHACELIDYPNYYESKMLDIEIEIPEEEE